MRNVNEIVWNRILEKENKWCRFLEKIPQSVEDIVTKGVTDKVNR
jgi:hypothetical protein